MATSKFCKVDDVKELLNIPSDWNDVNTKIEGFIKTATALARAYTRRDWEKKSYTEYFGSADVVQGIAPLGNGMKYEGGVYYAICGERPINTGVDPVVKYNIGGRFADTDPLEKDVDYTIDLAKNAFVFYPGRLSYTPRSIQIVYTAGFDVDAGTPGVDADPDADPPVEAVAAIPADTALLLVDENLKSAVATQAAFMYARMMDQEAGQSEKANSRGSARFNIKPTGLCAESQAILKSYVKLFVGR